MYMPCVLMIGTCCTCVVLVAVARPLPLLFATLTEIHFLSSQARQAPWVTNYVETSVTALAKPVRLSLLENLSNQWSISSKNTVALRSEEHTSELQSQSNLVCRL